MKRAHVVYALTLVLSALFLFAGNRIARGDASVFGGGGEPAKKVRVEQVLSRIQDETGSVTITFSARGEDGMIEAVQSFDQLTGRAEKEVSPGDTVLVFRHEASGEQWLFLDYVRTGTLMALAGVFLVCLLIFGRIKGLNTVVALVFTCLAIFAVFIPSILSGRNIYASSVIICCFIVVMTLLTANGADQKSLAAIAGCFGGLVAAALITLIMDNLVHLTGVVNEESVYLTYLDTPSPIDLKAIVFGAVLLGATGAIMDVSMSISSSVMEVARQMERPAFGELALSGIRIGRDVMATMVNTLVLAYIGGSLSLVLILVTYNNSLLELMNKEMIVVEVLQALTGSLGMLLAIPLTSIFASYIITRRSGAFPE